MFEFIPLDSTVSMNELASEKVVIDFELTQRFDGIGCYELKNNDWKKIGELQHEDASINEKEFTYEEANSFLQEDFINSYPDDSISPEIKNKCDYELKVNMGLLAYDDLLKAGLGAEVLKDSVSEGIKNDESSGSRF